MSILNLVRRGDVEHDQAIDRIARTNGLRVRFDRHVNWPYVGARAACRLLLRSMAADDEEQSAQQQSPHLRMNTHTCPCDLAKSELSSLLPRVEATNGRSLSASFRPSA